MINNFSFNDAYRIVNVIDERIRLMTRSGAGIEVTWGTVASLDAGRTCSVFLFGDSVASGGFRYENGVSPNVGDPVRVSMDKRGNRWIDAVLDDATLAFPKLEIDVRDGEIRSGNGTAAPTPITSMIKYNVKDYGAIGDGVADDTTAIQAALTAAGPNQTIYFPHGTYNTSATLTFQSGQRLVGFSGPQVQTGQTKIVYVGAGAVAVLAPLTPTSNTINVVIENISVDSGANGTIGINFTRTSYSRLSRFTVIGGASAVGVLLDAVTSGQCYFNVLDQGKYISGTGVKFSRGANVNQVLGGAFIGCGTSMHFESLSAGNTVLGSDMETATTRHVYLDSTANTFIGLHMEGAPIGYEITANGGANSRINTTYASSITTPVSEAAGSRDAIVHELALGTKPKWSNGLWRMTGDWFSTSTPWEFDAMPFSGTASSVFRFFKNINTTGTRQFEFYKGDGTTTVTAVVNAAIGDIGFIGKLLYGPNRDRVFQTGTGTPEAVVTAPPGSLYLNLSGGAGTTLYVKQTGTGNTGWVGK